MFKNEVLIEESDKKRLMELLNEAHSILEEYEFSSDYKYKAVTVMMRAKGFVREAREWCRYLHIKE